MAINITQKAVKWLTLASGHLKKDVFWNKKWKPKYTQPGEVVFFPTAFSFFPRFPFLQIIFI